MGFGWGKDWRDTFGGPSAIAARSPKVHLFPHTDLGLVCRGIGLRVTVLAFARRPVGACRCRPLRHLPSFVALPTCLPTVPTTPRGTWSLTRRWFHLPVTRLRCCRASNGRTAGPAGPGPPLGPPRRSVSAVQTHRLACWRRRWTRLTSLRRASAPGHFPRRAHRLPSPFTALVARRTPFAHPPRRHHSPPPLPPTGRPACLRTTIGSRGGTVLPGVR